MGNNLNLVKSSFIPDSSLQGGELPVYAIWNTEKKVNVIVYFSSECLVLKELYNVKKEGLANIKGGVCLSAFEADGYVGMVFKAKINKEHTVETSVRLIIKSSDDLLSDEIKQTILLFRPQIILLDKPLKISTALHKDGYISIDNRIHIRNEGIGTAIVKMELSPKSEITLIEQEDIEKFVEKFRTILFKKFNEIKETYPVYSQLIDNFIRIIKSPVPFNKENLILVERTFNDLVKAIEENEQFGLDLASAIIASYFSSVNLITEIHTFLEYLKSIAKRKVLLYNALSVLNIKPGLNKLEAKLTITDLESSEYEPIEISTQIFSNMNETVRIPTYSIFNWMDIKEDIIHGKCK